MRRQRVALRQGIEEEGRHRARILKMRRQRVAVRQGVEEHTDTTKREVLERRHRGVEEIGRTLDGK